MRRDISFYFSADVETVYNAYLAAASDARFRRACTQQPYHTISFSMNFSMKYNMNGGSCTLHFIPYEQGTAVDFRFALVQAFGARYGTYAQDLTIAAAALINVPWKKVNVPINMFLDPRNQVSLTSANSTQQTLPNAPQQELPPAPQPQIPAEVPGQCPNCGNTLLAGAPFCHNCGTKIEARPSACPQCGASTDHGGKFCAQCGSPLDG